MLYALLVVIHIVISLFLIGVVLLQTGKRADLAAAFGGGSSQTAFGTRGAATLLSKATTICAVIFMLSSLGLSLLSSRSQTRPGTVLEEVELPAATAPVTPAPEAAPQTPAPGSTELPAETPPQP